MRKSSVVPLIAKSLVLVVLLSACAAPAQQRVVEVTKIVEVTAAPGAAAPAAAPVAAATGETLAKVKARGKLICGVSGQVPAFSFVDSAGKYTGIDIDLCRAVSAAVFGDSEKVEFRNLTTQQRFTALQSGEIDILSRNSTWTLQRDTELGLNFAGVTFYDGQGVMVPTSLKVTNLEGLKDKTICVQKGTTTELNLADQMGVRGIAYKPLSVETADDATAAYEAERCDAYTTDISGLVARKSRLKDPAAHVILDVVLSKEPLGPVVRHGDDQWFDIVKWSFNAMLAAEEYNVDSKNVDTVLAETKVKETLRLLGKEGDMGKKLGLENNWAYNIIKTVGNYAEVYDRHLGPNTPTSIPRGINRLWKDGGLMYAPPVR
jgi:general L-amino acid transport system substrate-binding protein